MGHRTNPIGMRLGITRDWNALWFAGKKDYASFLKEDICIREFFQKSSPTQVLLGS